LKFNAAYSRFVDEKDKHALLKAMSVTFWKQGLVMIITQVLMGFKGLLQPFIMKQLI